MFPECVGRGGDRADPGVDAVGESNYATFAGAEMREEGAAKVCGAK